MSAETQKVDVLAVMDIAKSRINGPFGSVSANISAQLGEARAAVASLIEAANIGLGWINGPTKGDREARERLRAALARIGGAA